MPQTSSGTSGGVVVWDSSVLIPLILPRSKSTALYARLDAAGWIVAATPAILQETRDKLETKLSLKKWLGLGEGDISQFVENVLPALVRLYPGSVAVAGAVVADPNDDMVVAAAVESQAQFIVTEDRHLLDLVRYGEISIVSRDAFGWELERLGVP